MAILCLGFEDVEYEKVNLAIYLYFIESCLLTLGIMLNKYTLPKMQIIDGNDLQRFNLKQEKKHVSLFRWFIMQPCLSYFTRREFHPNSFTIGSKEGASSPRSRLKNKIVNGSPGPSQQARLPV